MVIFYVNNVLLLYRKEDKEKAVEFKRRLAEKYEIRDEGDIKWFLGIRVIRDRQQRKIWLCQSSYIEKIAKKFDLLKESTRFPSLPIPSKEFVKNPGQAAKGQIKIYQEKIGSVLYMVVMTRPDIARALLVLLKFMTNPSDEYMKAID
jgi:hypothetical protein